MTVRRAFAAALLLLASSSPGCGDDEHLELGAQCEFTTECASPYVCRIGRCREECIGSRDCPPGAVCLQDNDGRGACRLPPEAECADDADCPSILVCASGRCRNECTVDDDCPDGTCEEVVPGLLACAEPTPEDAGAADAGPADAGTDPGPPTFDECTGDGDCGDGMRCLSLRSEPQLCRPTCDITATDPDAECPGDTICMQASSGVSVVGVCTHRCTIGTTDGCPTGSVCDLFSETRDGGDKVFFSECRSIGAGEVCEPCTAGSATTCGEGMTCTFHDLRTRCVNLCIDASDCPSGESCDDFDEASLVEGILYGRCIPAETCNADGGV